MHSPSWKTITLASVEAAVSVIRELADKRWLARGHAKIYGTLTPSIDRPPRSALSRDEKLLLERQSIDAFRSAAVDFAHEGERQAMTDDPIALTVLQHYGVPTRVLDWSQSPAVAAYFAASDDHDQNGEIWAFDEPLYERADCGPAQWRRWPETTVGGTGNPADFQPHATAFQLLEPPPWIICIFYGQLKGFPRQKAQHGVFTMTGRFGVDHAAAIAALLHNDSAHVRYVLRKEVKPGLLQHLRTQHQVWRGALFPDAAGAADIAKRVFRRGTP